jgi:hypothetical protein
MPAAKAMILSTPCGDFHHPGILQWLREQTEASGRMMNTKRIQGLGRVGCW